MHASTCTGNFQEAQGEKNSYHWGELQGQRTKQGGLLFCVTLFLSIEFCFMFTYIFLNFNDLTKFLKKLHFSHKVAKYDLKHLQYLATSTHNMIILEANEKYAFLKIAIIPNFQFFKNNFLYAQLKVVFLIKKEGLWQ